MSSTGKGSRAGRREGCSLAGAAVLFAGLFFAPGRLPSNAQEPGAPVISRIVVQVDGSPADRALDDLIPFRPGDPYSPRAVDQAVKQIYRTGLFSDIQVLKTGEDKVDLVFALFRNLFIDQVKFFGTKARPARLRDGLVALRPGGVFREDRIPAAVEEVRKALAREGWFEADVAAEVKRRPDDSGAVLEFRASSSRRYRIRSIRFEGKPGNAGALRLRRTKTRPGELYVPRRLEDDLEALSARYAALGYHRAEIRLARESFDREGGTVDLGIEVLPQEKIRIIVNGAKIPARLLEPIWEERIFEQWGLAEGEVRVLNHLRRKGYLGAAVESRIERTGDEIRVVHDVSRGDRVKIEKVDFQGLTAFSPEALKTRLAFREGVAFFALLRYDRLFSIPREIELFYKENGFADVQVRLDLVREKTGLSAAFIVQEGPKKTVASVRLEGASLFPPETLLRELVNKPGFPYYPPNVQRDVGQIETFYLNRGVRGSEVFSRVESAGENGVSLVYEIREGRKLAVRNIFVTGNRATRRRVIDKEIQIRPGQDADHSRIQDSKRRLERLGIFSEVRVDEVQTGPDDEVVVVTVREGEKNYAGLGLGFESLNRLSGSLASWPNDFRPRGTAEYIRNNVFGLGAQFGVLAQLSTRERRVVASWNQPYLFGLAMPTTAVGWAEREERESFTYDRRGVSLNTIRPLGKSRLLLATLSLSRTQLIEVDLENPPGDIDRRFLPYSAALASISVSWERRDDTLNPEHGYYFATVAEWGVPVFGMDSDYQKVFFKSQFFKPIFSGWGLGLTARLGLGRGLRKLPERFFAGGSNTFRGEEFDRLGPFEAETLKPIGGEAVLLINSELTIPVIRSWKELRAVAFFDLGNVYGRLRDFRPLDLQGAAGAGIRYRTPLGPVRVEIAWKLWTLDITDKKGKPLIFLTIGNIF